MEQAGTREQVVVLEGALVGLFDILGAKAMDIPRAQRAVEQLQASVGFVGQEVPKSARIVAGALGIEVEGIDPPLFRLFGDSVLFVWAPDRPKPPANLLVAGLWFQALLLMALRNGVPLRGAVGYGDIAISGQTALGPGLVDAAEWYEAVDWIGAIATPRCGLLWEALALRQDPAAVVDLFVRWPVPLRDGTQASMWALSWPVTLARVMSLLAEKEGRVVHPRRMLLHWMAQNPIPRGTESKYEHALAFYDGFQALYPELLTQPAPSPPTEEERP
jgi:hypothetical protein